MKSSSTNNKTNDANDNDDSNDMIMENNGNIFLSKFSKMSINDNSNCGSRQLTNNTSMSDSLLYNSRKTLNQNVPTTTTAIKTIVTIITFLIYLQNI